MEKKVLEIIKDQDLIKKKERVAVALSGGGDSLALLFLLKKLSKSLKIDLLAIHVNHQIRGVAADKDQAYVKALCEKCNIDFQAFSVDVPSLAKKEKISMELAARKARYRIFEKYARDKKVDKIALGHHANDQAETVLHNFLRGAMVNGLKGMRIKRGIYIRPLLTSTKEEIMAYLEENKIDYCKDLTNDDSRYTRNSIRNQLIPLIEDRYNPNIVKNLVGLAKGMGYLADYIEGLVGDIFSKALVEESPRYISLDIDKISQNGPYIFNEVILYAIKYFRGSKKDIDQACLKRIFALVGGQTGKKVPVISDIYATKSYKFLIIYKEKNDRLSEQAIFYPIKLDISPIKRYIELIGMYIEVKVLQDNFFDYIRDDAFSECFDSAKIREGLVIRTRARGDYMIIDKEGHRKKLGDIYSDLKIPAIKRDESLILADGSRVLWIIGYKTSPYYHISQESSQAIMVSICKD